MHTVLILTMTALFPVAMLMGMLGMSRLEETLVEAVESDRRDRVRAVPAQRTAPSESTVVALPSPRAEPVPAAS